MTQPLVSIITPSYNQGRFIRATIESVFAQDYPNIEYIIMDGGSSDETASIAQEYASRLTFVSEKDRGQSHAINKGFRMARGEVVSWLNSDDIILPGAVTHAVRAFERTPTLGAVYGEGYLIDCHGNVKSRFPYTEPFNLWKLIYLSDYILQQTVYFRRSVFDEIGFLNEEFHWGLDWDLLIRIGKEHWIEYIPEYMGCLREHEEAKTFTGGRQRFRELATIMRSHGEMRYPPGYFTYGLGTYTDIICRYLPFEFLRDAVKGFTYGCARYVQRKTHGLHADGWAPQHLKYMLPVNTGKVRIAGTLPALKPLEGQRLTIYCDGSIAEQRDLSFGDFEIEFDCRKPGRQQPIKFDIKATKTLNIASFLAESNRRRVAYLLRKVEHLDGR